MDNIGALFLRDNDIIDCLNIEKLLQIFHLQDLILDDNTKNTPIKKVTQTQVI
jgi:hypothetical protein